jgi:predicted secreted protein
LFPAFSLNENPSIGFSWVMTNTSGIEILKNTFATQKSPILSPFSIAGRGGVRTWILKMTGTDIQVFSGTYKQPWMPDSGNNAGYIITLM